MYRGNGPNLVNSDEDFGQHMSEYSDNMRPNLVNETSTDLKLNLLANHMKITVHDDSEKKASDENVIREENTDDLRDDTVNTQTHRRRSDDSLAVSSEAGSVKYPRATEREAVPPPLDANSQRFRKIELLRIFHELEEKGIQLSSRYNMNSNLQEMEQEYEILRSLQMKKNGVRLYKGFLLNSIQALEFMNETYNPFDFHLKGWSENVGSGIDDYDDVLGELYEKYKKTGKKMEPEIKLVLMLATSATAFHASNTYLKSVPGLDEVIKKNPKIINNIAKNIVKDPEPAKDFPPEFRTQAKMKAPNPREFLNKMREQQGNRTDTFVPNEFIPNTSSRPPRAVETRDSRLDSETISEITSTSKKKKKGITINI